MLKGRVTPQDERARKRFVERYTRTPGLPKEEITLTSAAGYIKQAEKLEARRDELLREAEGLRIEALGLRALAEHKKTRDAKVSPVGEHYASREQSELRSRERTDSLKEMQLPAEHALAISRGVAKRAAKRGGTVDPLVRAAQSMRMTLRGLARELETPASQLSMARRGLRPIDRNIADRIQALTGFEATEKNWPGGIT